MKKIAIIGASYLQNPLILKAKEMGIETHVFAWSKNDVGEKTADFFYPISIVEKEEIYRKCLELKIDGICSIASDLAVETVTYVANRLKLVSNSMNSCTKSTNKYYMRKCFEENGDPIPRFTCIKNCKLSNEIDNFSFPVIVKPVDRSGSRGIYKCNNVSEVIEALKQSTKISFQKAAMIEEFIEGKEYSIECISYEGNHHLLNVTKKYTTGSPHYIETGHLEPAPISENLKSIIEKTVFHALDSLEIKYGASHSEIKICDGKIKIIEIGARMGGDFIGSDLVRISTGFDYIEGVIKTALGEKLVIPNILKNNCVAVKFIMNRKDISNFAYIKSKFPKMIYRYEIDDGAESEVTDSSNRHGYYILTTNNKNIIDIALGKDNDE